jgi:catechol 2,3-dioxygenase-like lactoylglutathione lyase family enzyme
MKRHGIWRRSFLRVHAVNVYVRDQERSLCFYLDMLGFRIAFDAGATYPSRTPNSTYRSPQSAPHG